MSRRKSEEDTQPVSPTGETGELFLELEDNNFNEYCLDVTVENKIIEITKKYGDFYLLNEQLKVIFPSIQLLFPPLLCKESVTEDFLIERQCGLEQFIENVVCHRRMINSDPVKDFVGVNEKVVNISFRDQAFDEVLHLQDETLFAGEGLGVLQVVHLSDETRTEKDKEYSLPKRTIAVLQEDFTDISKELEAISESDALYSSDQLECIRLATNVVKDEIHRLWEHLGTASNRVEDTRQEYVTQDWSSVFDKLAKTEMKQCYSKSLPYDDMNESPTESDTDDYLDHATSSCLPSIPECPNESASGKVNAFASQWMKRGKELIKSTMEIAKPAGDPKTIVSYRKDAGNEVEFKEKSPTKITAMNTKSKPLFMKNEKRVVQHQLGRAISCESLQWDQLY